MREEVWPYYFEVHIVINVVRKRDSRQQVLIIVSNLNSQGVIGDYFEAPRLQAFVCAGGWQRNAASAVDAAKHCVQCAGIGGTAQNLLLYEESSGLGRTLRFERAGKLRQILLQFARHYGEQDCLRTAFASFAPPRVGCKGKQHACGD